MIKKKGNPKYKKITRYRNSKLGIRTYKSYIPRKNTYQFKVNDGSKLTVMAFNKNSAIKEAKRWTVWVVRHMKKNYNKSIPKPIVRYDKLVHKG